MPQTGEQYKTVARESSDNSPIRAASYRPGSDDGQQKSFRHLIQSPGYEHIRVLVISDREREREVLVEMLRKFGFRTVTETNSGLSGLKRLEDGRADLVLVNLHMSGMGGLELIRTAKTIEFMRHVHFILMSSSITITKELQALEIGASDLLKTPVIPTALGRRLNRVVAKILLEEKARDALHIDVDRLTRDSQLRFDLRGRENWRVLVVDQDDQLRKRLVQLLYLIGFRTVLEARSGSNAHRKIKAGHCDLVICNWHMPGLGGNSLLRTVRSDGMTVTLPFIVMSGDGSEKSVLKALRGRANDYLLKPLDYDKITQMLTRLLDAEDDPRPQVLCSLGLDEEQAIECAKNLLKAALSDDESIYEALPKTKVLVVESDERVRCSMVCTLKRLGFRFVYETGYSVSALKKLEGGLVDLVFCGKEVSPVNGLELVRHIRSIDFLRQMPFVLIASAGAKDQVVEALRAGVNDYLTRPCSIEDLAHSVARVYGGKLVSSIAQGAPGTPSTSADAITARS